MPADLEKFVADSLPEFLLLVARPDAVFAVGDAIRCLQSVVVCYDAQHFYKNLVYLENLGAHSASSVVEQAAAPVDLDEFAAYCESKIASRFAELRDYRCTMNVSDLIRMDAWARLYAGVGQRLMKFLLFDCLLFVPLPGGGDDVTVAAYYCVHSPTTAVLAARHQVIRSFQALAGKRWAAAATPADRKRGDGTRKTADRRRPSPSPTGFNIVGLLRDVQPIREVDADRMFREIQNTRVTDCRGDDDDDDRDDETSLDGLKRKLNAIAAKHSLATLRGIYADTVGDRWAAEVPLGRVKKFAAAVARKTVPRELYGPGGNRDRYCENLCRVLDGGMRHDFTVQHVVHKIKVRRVGWLRAVAADRRAAVMARTLVWLTNAFVFARIAHFFRIVATNKPANGIAYFARAVWAAACAEKISPLMAADGGGFFTEVRAAAGHGGDVARRPATYTRWRVCPYAKPNGRVRLIFKLQHRETGAQKQLTDQCLTFLRCLTRTYPPEFRSVSRAQFFRRWRLLSPPLYYVRTDFRDAFTSLGQGKLLAVIRDRIREHFGDASQTLYAHSVHVVRTGGSVFCKRHSYFDGLPAPEFAAGSLVFYDTTDAVPLARVWDAVRRRVRRNAVVRRGRVWAMTRGVVQGDRLSVALCDLLLADLQASRLARFGGAHCPASGLYRFVDDYVFVSPDRAEALRFLDTMQAGFDEYGVRLNRFKTVTNATDESGGGDGGCTFLGFRLDAATGAVTRDESVYRGRRPLHFFDYGLGRGRPGRALYAKITRPGQHPVPVALVSHELNTTGTAARNLASVVAYKAFGVAAAVKHYYFHLNADHVLRTVHAVARLMYAKLCALARRSAVTPMQCKWIVYEVYARVFRARLSGDDARVTWTVQRLRVRQADVGRRCDTRELKAALRRGYDFTKMFG